MNWTKMRRTAARPRRNLADAALARQAARQWHPALNRDWLNTRWKEREKGRQMFSNAYEADR